MDKCPSLDWKNPGFLHGTKGLLMPPQKSPARSWSHPSELRISHVETPNVCLGSTPVLARTSVRVVFPLVCLGATDEESSTPSASWVHRVPASNVTAATSLRGEGQEALCVLSITFSVCVRRLDYFDEKMATRSILLTIDYCNYYELL